MIPTSLRRGFFMEVKRYSFHPQFIASETTLIGARFPNEGSSLQEVNSHFPVLEGKDFVEWVNCLSQKDGRILELGGGPQQVVALEILKKFPGISFTALEKRALTPSMVRVASKSTNYALVAGGISQLGDFFEGQRFDLVFAHIVMEHLLPDQLLAIYQACQLLDKGGLFFCNRAPLYSEDIDGFVDFIEREGAQVAYRTFMPGVFRKPGVALVDIGIKVAETGLGGQMPAPRFDTLFIDGKSRCFPKYFFKK